MKKAQSSVDFNIKHNTNKENIVLNVSQAKQQKDDSLSTLETSYFENDKILKLRPQQLQSPSEK